MDKNKKRSKRSLIAMFALMFALIVALAGCGGGSGGGDDDGGSADGGADKTYTLRIGTGSGGKDNQNVFMEKMKERLEAESDGRIQVQLYPAGQIGNLAQLVQGVQDGSVDSVCIPTTYFATVVPEMSVLDIPYIWTNDEGARALMDNETSLTPLLEEKKVMPIAWIKNCERHMISTKDLTNVKTIDELKNMSMKIWCNPSEILQDEVKALGGVPSNIDVGEITPSLQNGTIDAALLSSAIAQPFGMYEVAPYWLKAPGDPMISVYMIHKPYFEALPEDLQELILTVSAEVNEEVYVYAGEYEQDCLDKMVEGGLTIIEPSAELAAGIEASCTEAANKYLDKYPQFRAIYDELRGLVE